MAWANKSRRRAELPKDWPEIRGRVLTRDGGRCKWPLSFGGTCGRPANEVDHKAGAHDHTPANLWALCHEHHAAKTARESRDAKPVATPKARPSEAHPGSLTG